MVFKKNDSLVSEFRRERGQTQESPQKLDKPVSRGRNNIPKRQCGDAYTTFLIKFDDLDNYIDRFKTRDLVYYFREVAGEVGIKYTISNIKKDMAIFKRLQSNYSVREICSMIEFLFKSEQDYLDKPRISPNILVSSWVNTVYADMQDWVEGKYTPKNKKKHIKKEWTQSTESNDTKVGDWD